MSSLLKKVLFICLFLLVSFGLVVQIILPGDSIIFKVFTWDRSISRFFKPRLEIVAQGNGGVPVIIKNYSQDHYLYYLYNFSNSLDDYNLVNNNLRTVMESEGFFKSMEKDDKRDIHFAFLWNNIFNSSNFLIPEVETATGKIRVGLFGLSVNFYNEGYYYTNISEWDKLNNWGKRHRFSKVDSQRVETNTNCFDFIFWVQAEDYMDKEFPDRMGKKIDFYNGNKKVAEFDYSSGKGYKIILDR